jgi:hypothetical protein
MPLLKASPEGPLPSPPILPSDVGRDWLKNSRLKIRIRSLKISWWHETTEVE